MSVRQKGVAELRRTVSLETSWTNIQNADCEYPAAANIRKGASSRYNIPSSDNNFLLKYCRLLHPFRGGFCPYPKDALDTVDGLGTK